MIRLGQSLCYFDKKKDIIGQNIKNDNDSVTLSTDDSNNSNDEDENLNITHEEEDVDQQLLIDTVALDAAIVDADAIADQQVISNHNNEDENDEQSTSIS